VNQLARAYTWLGAIVWILSACAAPATLTPTRHPTPSATSTLAATRISFPTPLAPTPLPALPRLSTATPVPLSAPPPTPRPLEFDDVDARALLTTLFPDFKFTPDADVFRVNDNPNWTIWITSQSEGRFTQDDLPELAALIANDVPRALESERDAPRGLFLAIFQRRADKLHVVQRAFPFPTALVPPAFDARIERATDFDRDGRNELLIVTTVETWGVSTAAAFLYWWDDQVFVPIWSAPLAEDNTSALNQPEYYATEAQVRFTDVDGDGWDEIILDGLRVDFARDAQGLADTDRITRRRTYRQVYRWSGAMFVLDPARVTPLPK
jgi:hypothetical protein